MREFVKMHLSPPLVWTDLCCRGGSGTTSGKELLTLTKRRELWEHSLLFASVLSVVERDDCLNCNIFLLANTFLQREGGGEGPSEVYFWCHVESVMGNFLF